MAEGSIALNPISYWALPEISGVNAAKATSGTMAGLANGAASTASVRQGRGVALDGARDFVQLARRLKVLGVLEIPFASGRPLSSYRRWGTNAGRAEQYAWPRHSPLGLGTRMGWGNHLAGVLAARGAAICSLRPASRQFQNSLLFGGVNFHG